MSLIPSRLPRKQKTNHPLTPDDSFLIKDAEEELQDRRLKA